MLPKGSILVRGHRAGVFDQAVKISRLAAQLPISLYWGCVLPPGQEVAVQDRKRSQKNRVPRIQRSRKRGTEVPMEGTGRESESEYSVTVSMMHSKNCLDSSSDL